MNEAEGVVTFTVVKRTQTTETVTVLFTTADGSATGMYTFIYMYLNLLVFKTFFLFVYFFFSMHVIIHSYSTKRGLAQITLCLEKIVALHLPVCNW